VEISPHRLQAALQRGAAAADIDFMAAAITAPSDRAARLARRARVRAFIASYPAPTALGMGIALTGLVAFVPSLRFAYENSQGRMALETTAALIGLFTVVLLVARFFASGSIADLGLAGGLAFGVLANLAYSVIPLAVGATPGHRFTTWAPLLSRLLGSTLFAAASFLPTRKLARPTASAALLAIGLAATLVAIGMSVQTLKGHLPAGLSPPPTKSVAPSFDVPVISALQLVALFLNGVAALGLARRYRRTRDELYGWLSVGMALACCASMNYVLYPSLYSNWVYTGDAFRLASGLALLTGAVYEIRRYWIEATKTAVLEERRRIARDLHDGIAQELAFIGRRATRIEAEGSDVIRAAAERALGETRRTLAVLSRPLDEPFSRVLAHAAEVAGARWQTPVHVDVDESIEVDPRVREGLTMIAREAVTNAARHADASLILVEVARDPRTSLRIRDDGVGFDPESVTDGYGLRIMRERAAAIGGEFRVETAPRSGTLIEVTMP
jgi:signal transduction histidine kinase